MSYSPEQISAIELLRENEFQRLVENAKRLVAADTERTAGITSPENTEPPDLADSEIGDYELLEEIARGGMGVVYRARHKQLGRICALKMIRSGQLASKEEVSRFYGEAEAAASLDHPGIVPVYDVGKIGHHHYFSMGLVEGHSLAEDLREGPFEPGRAATLTKQIADAIAYAHKRNVIHRDLKPANVLLDSNGRPRVTDFGLAKKTHGDKDLTATGQILGTPSFMPPEQATGKVDEVNEFADIYSLGAILYTLLTARPPFQAASQMDILFQVLNQEPLPPSKLTPKIPRELETICLKCLHKEPSRRYESASDLAADIDRWLNNKPIVARRVSTREKTWLWCKRNPVIVGAACLLLLAGLVGLAALYESRAIGLRDSLINADVENVTEIRVQLPFYAWRLDPKLLPIASNEQNARASLHAKIGLVKRHPEFAESLKDALIDESLDYEYLQVIGDALISANVEFTEDLWAEMRDKTQNDSRRFRAGLVLSIYAGGVDEWKDLDSEFLVQQYLNVSPEFYQTIRQYLYRNRTSIRDQLSAAFFDNKATRIQQLATARAVREFYPTDYDYLLPMLLTGSAYQYNELYPLFENTSELDADLLSKVKERPGEKMNIRNRIRLGRERAGAAITLLRKGIRDSIPEVLRYDSDPEALTQFICRCRDRGVALSDLLYLFWEVDQRRGSFYGDRQKIDDSVMYALLLAMGQYGFEQVPEPRQSLVDRLAEIYEKDPSSAVHGSTGWLLRKWCQNEQVKRVDQTPLAFDKSEYREWYVEEINLSSGINDSSGNENKLYLTFIVFPGGEFQMGSPSDEPSHQPDESLQTVKLTRPFAVCDREVTWEQWIAMNGSGKYDLYARRFSKTLSANEPACGMDWFEAIGICRWLTTKSGMAEEEQCFVDSSTLEKDRNGYPIQWPVHLDKAGFRLPTEAESEYILRSGTSTAYSFGNDVSWLGQYAWHNISHEWSHPVGQLAPNPRGLFDTHGNLWEWCYDWYPQRTRAKVDPTGASLGINRVLRGGSWGNRSMDCRSAYRGFNTPSNRHEYFGFRVFRSLVETSQHQPRSE